MAQFFIVKFFIVKGNYEGFNFLVLICMQG